MIYDTIKSICDERGIAITTVEKKAGLGTGTIGKWRTASPSIKMLERVANALEVPVSYLVSDIGNYKNQLEKNLEETKNLIERLLEKGEGD